MQTRTWTIVSTCMVMASLAFAADPWRQKKSSQWTVADAQLVITHSPWAIAVKLKCGNPLVSCDGGFRPPEPVSQPHVGDARPIAPPPLPDPGTLDPTTVPIPGMSVCVGSDQICHPPDLDKRVSEIQERLGVSQTSVAMTVPPSLQGTVIVLWESATPVRAAKAMLGLAATSNRRAAGSYVVSVIGYPMQTAIGQQLDLKQPLSAEIRSVIQQPAKLTPKGRHPIEASEIEIEGTGNAMNVRFFFPAEEVIATTDKTVQFRMQVLFGDIVEADFSPKAMIYAGKPAISEFDTPVSLHSEPFQKSSCTSSEKCALIRWESAVLWQTDSLE